MESALTQTSAKNIDTFNECEHDPKHLPLSLQSEMHNLCRRRHKQGEAVIEALERGERLTRADDQKKLLEFVAALSSRELTKRAYAFLIGDCQSGQLSGTAANAKKLASILRRELARQPFSLAFAKSGDHGQH